MKIILIDPPGYSYGLNIGLGYLGSALKEQGNDVLVLDLNNLRRKNSYHLLKETITNLNPNFVGFSIHSLTYNIFRKMIKEIRNFYKGFIIAGGPQAAVEGEKIFEDNPLLNFSFIGEAEKSLIKLINSIENINEWEKIPGLIYCLNENVINSLPNILIDNLDSLPLPDYELFGIKRISNYPLLTSRGCPFSCTFCFSHFGNKWRKRSAESCVRELKISISKYKIKSFSIVDAVFNIDTERVMNFCDLLIKENIKLPWKVEGIRADKVSDNLAKKMAKAGCTGISIGVETLNEEIFKTLKKGETLEEIKDAVKIFNKNKIKVAGNFIIGLPKDNYKSVLSTYKSAKKMGFHSIVLQLLVPYPKTEVYDWVKKNARIYYNYKEVDTQDTGIGTLKVSFDTEDFTKEEKILLYEVISIKEKIYPTRWVNEGIFAYTLRIIFKCLKYDFWNFPLHLFNILYLGVKKIGSFRIEI